MSIGEIMNLAIICTDAADLYQLNLITALTKLCSERGITTSALTVNVAWREHPSADIDQVLVAWAENSLFDAYVLLVDPLVINSDMPSAARILKAISRRPGVVIGQPAIPLPTVTVDNEQPMQDMIRHLFVSHGYRHFLFLLGPENSFDGSQREEAIRRQMAQYPEALVEYQRAYFQEDIAYDLVKARIEDTAQPFPRVISACNDNMAFGALRALTEAGIAVPSECAVTGFDDVELAALQVPSLTTIRQEPLATAQAVLDLLASAPPSETRSAIRQTVPTTLILRESCGCSRDAHLDYYRERLALSTNAQSQDNRFRTAVSDFSLSINAAESVEELVNSLTHFSKVAGVSRLAFGLFDSNDYLQVLPIYPSSTGVLSSVNKKISAKDFIGPMSPHLHNSEVNVAFLLLVSGELQGVFVCQCDARLMQMIRIVASHSINTLQRLRMTEKLLNHTEELEAAVELRTQSLTLALRELEKEVHQRRQLEGSLQQERQALETILNNQPIPLLIISEPSNHVLFVNQPAREMLQLKGSELHETVLLSSINPLLSWVRGQNKESIREFKIEDSQQTSHQILASGAELTLRGERSHILCMVDISQQKQLEKELLTIAEQERERVGMEIHDDVCQQIAALSIYAGMVRDEVRARGKPPSEMDDLIHLIHTLQARARAISKGLFPKDVGFVPIAEVIHEFLMGIEKQTGLICHFEADPQKAGSCLNFEEQLHVFRIVQETVQNAIKHAKATRLQFRLIEIPGELQLSYQDNGKGFREASEKGIELRTIRYRAAQLSGILTVGDAPEGQGACLNLRIPLKSL